MQESPALGVYFKAWLIFFVLANVCGFIVGAGAGALTAAVLAAIGYTPQHPFLVGAIVGVVLTAPVSFLFFWFCVKQFVVRKLAPPAVPSPNAGAS